MLKDNFNLIIRDHHMTIMVHVIAETYEPRHEKNCLMIM